MCFTVTTIFLRQCLYLNRISDKVEFLPDILYNEKTKQDSERHTGGFIMKVFNIRNLVIILIMAAIVAWLVLANSSLLGGYTGTFYLHDDMEWTEISYDLSEGNADKFTAVLDGPQKIKVEYKGKWPVRAAVTLKDKKRNKAMYDLYLHEEPEAGSSDLRLEVDFNKIEEPGL